MQITYFERCKSMSIFCLIACGTMVFFFCFFLFFCYNRRVFDCKNYIAMIFFLTVIRSPRSWTVWTCHRTTGHLEVSIVTREHLQNGWIIYQPKHFIFDLTFIRSASLGSVNILHQEFNWKVVNSFRDGAEAGFNLQNKVTPISSVAVNIYVYIKCISCAT
jgi:hypothetical protein